MTIDHASHDVAVSDESAFCESPDRLKLDADALTRLNDLGSRLWHSSSLEEGLDEMLGGTLKLLGADMGNVQLLDREREVLVIAAQHGFRPAFLDYFRQVSIEDESACGRTFRSGKRTIIEDVESDPAYAPMRDIARAAGYRGVQSTPLVGRGGSLLGMLSTHWRRPHRPDEQTLRCLDLYVRQAADFIERSRGDEALRSSKDVLFVELEGLKSVHELTTKLLRTKDIARAAQDTLDTVLALVKTDMGTLQFYDREARGLRFVAFRGFEPRLIAAFPLICSGYPSTCARALESRRRVVVNDFQLDDASAGFRDAARELGTRAAQSTPLIISNGEVVGVFTTHFRAPRQFDDQELRLLDLCASQISAVIERHQAQEKLEQELADTRILQRLSADVSAKKSIQELYETVMDAAKDVMRSDFASMQMLYPDRGESGELRLLAFRGFSQAAAEHWKWVTVDHETTCGACLRTGERIQASDVETCKYTSGEADLAMFRQTGIRSCQTTPLKSRSGKLIGVISTHWAHPHKPSERDWRMMDVVARYAAEIIERKQSEETLRASEERFEFVRRTSGVGFWYCNLPFGTLQWDDQVKAHFHLPADATVTIQRFYELLHPDDREPIRRAIEKSIADRTIYDVDYRTVNPKTGALHWVQAIGRTFYAEDGTPIRFDGITIDVTERKRAEELLRESRFRLTEEVATLTGLEQLNSKLLVAADVQEAAGTTLEAIIKLMAADRGTAQIYDRQAEGLRFVVHRGFDPGALDAIPLVSVNFHSTCALALARGQRVAVEDFDRDPEGFSHRETAAVLGYRAAVSTPLMARSGEVLGVVTVHFAQPRRFVHREMRTIDLYVRLLAHLIERHNHELTIQQREADVTRARDYAEATLRTSPVPLLVLEQDLRIHTANEAFYKRFRVEPETTVGRRLYELGNGQWDIPQLRELLEHILPRETWFENFEVTHEFESIGVRTMELNGRRMQVKTGTGAARIILVIQDITERKAAEAELAKHREHLQHLVDERTGELEASNRQLRLSERMASLGTLAAGLGHDMGNLLVPIRVRLEVIENCDISDEARGEVSGIRSAVNYLQKLASGLRLLAVDPTASSRREPTELRAWWSEAGGVLKSCLPRGIVLSADLPATDCWVAMSKGALTQAVFNLVQNAGDALRGQNSATVILSAVPSSEGVTLSVADNGPGMSEEVKRRCMEPFFSTKPRGISTGLGLPLVYGLVQQSGGTIELKSEPGHGTSFLLRLASSPAPIQPAGLPRRARIEVHNARMRAIVLAELQALRFSVASGGLEESEDVDVLVTDGPSNVPNTLRAVIALSDAPCTAQNVVCIGERPSVSAIRAALHGLGFGACVGGGQ